MQACELESLPSNLSGSTPRDVTPEPLSPPPRASSPPLDSEGCRLRKPRATLATDPDAVASTSSCTAADRDTLQCARAPPSPASFRRVSLAETPCAAHSPASPLSGDLDDPQDWAMARVAAGPPASLPDMPPLTLGVPAGAPTPPAQHGKAPGVTWRSITRLLLASLLMGAACFLPAPPVPDLDAQLSADALRGERAVFPAACRPAHERAARPHGDRMAEQFRRHSGAEAMLAPAAEGVEARALERYKAAIVDARAPLRLGAHRGWTKDAELRAAAEQLSARLGALVGAACPDTRISVGPQGTPRC